MSWGVINGSERIIPQGGTHELKIEAGKTYKFRLLLQPGEEPFSFLEHAGDSEKVEGGQTTKVFRTIVCPKNKSNPYAHCALCDGQQIKRRARNAANIWSYDTNEVKVLKGGEDIWKAIGTLVKMGVDVSTLDFAVTRTGSGRNDTSYSVVSLGPSQTPLPADVFSMTYNMQEEYAPSTEEEQKSMVEALGMKWENAIVPPPIQYPKTLQEALSHVIPNTKYKDQTMKQVWDTNKGMIEFFAKSNRITPEKAAAQVILVNLGGAVIAGVPRYSDLPGGQYAAPVQQAAPVGGAIPGPVQQTAPAATTPGPVPTGNGRQDKVNQINKLLQSNDKFVKGGYQVIMDTMKQASNGKVSINEFTDAELDKMIQLCQ